MRKSIIILFLTIGGLLVSCKKDDPINPPYQGTLTAFEVALSKTNHLRAEVTATFSGETPFRIAYWEASNPAKVQQTNSYEGKGTEHKTLLFLKPNTEYACKLLYGNGLETEVKHFKTKEVQAFLPNATITKDELTEDLGGYFLTNNRPAKYIYLMDTQGVVVWYEQVPEVPVVVNYDARTQRFYMLTNPVYSITQTEASNFMLNSKAVKVIDLYGNVIFQKELSTIPAFAGRMAHHECRPMPDGSIGLVTYIDKTFDLSAKGGTATETVKGDGFVIIDLNGNVTKQWSCFDYVSPTDDPNIMSQGVKEDWLHANSFNYDSEGNYYMTFNRYGELWKIHGKTGELLYRVGRNGTLKPEAKYFAHGMHSANPQAPNEVLVIDNARSDADTGSRAILYKVNEQNKTVTVPQSIALPKGTNSANRSNAQFIGNDLTLFALSTRKEILITNRKENAEIKRYLTLQTPFYRVEYIPTIHY
ncbi:hypothetical protein RCZ04_17960 [Capnocytophaga sp. HP1101]